MIFHECLLCHEHSHTTLCKKCQQRLYMTVYTHLSEKKLRVPGTDIPMYSVASYKGPIKDVIKILKSPKLEESVLLSEWIWLSARRVAENFKIPQNLTIINLPEIRFPRDSRRPLAQDFAWALGSVLSSPLDSNQLTHLNPIKSLFYTQQKERNRITRSLYPPKYKINSPEQIRQKKILLVDDVCTTGESLRSAIKALNEKNVSVYAAAVLADTPIDG